MDSFIYEQEVPISVSRLTRDTSGQYTDFHILSSLNSQVSQSSKLLIWRLFLIFLVSIWQIFFWIAKLFESSALMHVSAVKSLLSALRQLSSQCISGNLSAMGQTSSQHTGSVAFSVERMTSILVNNLHSKYLNFQLSEDVFLLCKYTLGFEICLYS